MRPEPHGVSGTRKLSIPGMASGHWGTPAAAADFLARAFAPPRVRVLRARVVRGVESTFSLPSTGAPWWALSAAAERGGAKGRPKDGAGAGARCRTR